MGQPERGAPSSLGQGLEVEAGALVSGLQQKSGPLETGPFFPCPGLSLPGSPFVPGSLDVVKNITHFLSSASSLEPLRATVAGAASADYKYS